MVFLKSKKNNMPMHPIVSACDTTTYNTAKFITKILQNYSFDVSTLFTNIPLPVALQVINSKISTCTNFTNVCKIPIEKFIKLLIFTVTNFIFCFNMKFYEQLQGAAMDSPVSPVIANIYMEHFESLAIPTSQHYSNDGSGMLMMSTVPPGNIKSTNFKSTSIP